MSQNGTRNHHQRPRNTQKLVSRPSLHNSAELYTSIGETHTRFFGDIPIEYAHKTTWTLRRQKHSLNPENDSFVLMLNKFPGPSENRFVRPFLWTPLRKTAPQVQEFKPKICQGEDSEVTSQKRKISLDRPESPRKRQRGSSEPTEVAVETVQAKGTKRKASTQTKTPSKKQRGDNCDANTDKPTEVSVVGVTETEGRTEAFAEHMPATRTPRTPRRDSGCEVSPSSSSPSASQQDNGRASDSVSSSRANFEAKYLQLHKLGEGGFGSVYAGVRKSDNLPVVIKRIPKARVKYRQVMLDGMVYSLPLEAVLMMKVASGPHLVGQSAAVTLLDWYDLDQEILLVMERPVPSMDLLDYVNSCDSLTEDQAKNIMKQLVEACIKMHSVGVFHWDIKTDNVLIETSSDVPRVRIIDFGCDCSGADAAAPLAQIILNLTPPFGLGQDMI